MADAAAVATPTDGGAQPGTQDAAPQQAPVVQDAKAGETTSPGSDPKQETKAAEPRVYERKINGKAEKIPADVVDAAAKALGLEPAELLRGTQLAKAAYEKFEEARRIQQQLEGFKGKDPWDLVKEARGMKDDDLDALAEQRLIAKLQREAQLSQLTPAQQEYERQRVEFERQRAEFAAQQKAAQESALTAQATQIRNQMEPTILAAVEQAGLPRTPEAVRAVVAQLQTQHKYGLPLDVQAAVRDAQSQFVQPTAAMLAKMAPEQLVKMLGKDAVDAILRHSIAQKGGPTSQQVPKPAEVPQERPRTWMTTKEWDAAYLK